MIRISVCLALYNGADYIKEQLDSILGQLSDTDEIIISDDGSTDGSIKIIQELADPRIRLTRNTAEKNLILNFENALTHARGRYIFLSDQDDIWEPEKVEVMLTCLEEYDLVVCDCSIIDQKGDSINDSYFKLRRSGKGFIKNLIKNRYVGCCMAFNRFILEKSLPMPGNIPMHDWWIGMVAETCGTSFFCEKALVRYRRHKNNISPLTSYNQYSFLAKIRFRIQLFSALTTMALQKTNVTTG